MKLNKWHTRIFRLLASAAIFVGIFWFIPFVDVIEAFGRLKPGYLAGGFVLYFASTSLESFQLWMLLKRLGIPIGIWRIFETKMITRFYGQFLPSELLASAVKIHRLAGPTKQWGEVMAALAFLRVVNLLALLLMGLAFWAMEMPSGAGRWIGAVMFGMTAALGAAHVALANPTVGRYAKQILSACGPAWLKGRPVDKAKKLSRTMTQSYRLFGNMIWSITFIAIIRHGFGILSFGLIASSVGVSLSFLTIGWIRVVLHVLMMLPISLSGLGVREGSLVVLLQEYSVAAADAVAIAFLMLVIHLVGNSLGGLLELRNFLHPNRREIVTATTGVCPE